MIDMKKQAQKCHHCGSSNLDLNHAFPSCRDCYHFLPGANKARDIEEAMFINTYGKDR
jgi:hypothetical protein|tara:strand:- start:339 stop:512 length:174 start_codon:yes stop_codon:yes gene_type:complete